MDEGVHVSSYLLIPFFVINSGNQNCYREKTFFSFFALYRLVQHAYCDGVCSQSNRQFPDGAPLILIINVEFLAASGALASESGFPQQIKFLGKRY